VPTILVIEYDSGTAGRIADLLRVLTAPALQVFITRSVGDALDIPITTKIDCIVLDCDAPGCSGTACIPDIRRRWSSGPVIVITGLGSEDFAVSALKRYGATDYVAKRGDYLPKLLRCVRDGVCRAVFREEPLAWRVGYLGCETEFPALKGFDFIHQLLRSAGRFVPATQLIGSCAADAPVVATALAGENGMRISHDLGDRGVALDRHAATAYRARLHELAAMRVEAQARNDARSEFEIDTEVEDLRKELGRACRGTGRDGGHRESARVCVAKGLDRALERIRIRLPGLGGHLHARIRKGYECIYIPDPCWPLEWDL
jgi:CheY-like chemotaxis protein